MKNAADKPSGLWQKLVAYCRGLSIATVVTLPLSALALVMLLIVRATYYGPEEFLANNPELEPVLDSSGLLGLIDTSMWVAIGMAAVFAAVSVIGRLRKPFALLLVRNTYHAVYAGLLFHLFVVFAVFGTVSSSKMKIDGAAPTGLQMFMWECLYVLPALFLTALYYRFHLNTMRRTAIEYYGGTLPDRKLYGDRIVEKINFVTGNPRNRSIALSALVHFMLLILPIIFSLLQGVAPYLLPYGRGLPDAGGGAQAKAEGKKEKQKKKAPGAKAQKVNLKKLKGVVFSAAAGRPGGPNLSESALIEDIDKMTSLTHEASTQVVLGGKGTGTGGGRGPGNKAGGIGKGGVGPGGWPDGMKGSVIRFVRIEHAGEGWDDGMTYGRADLNFLEHFHDITGFKVADKVESIHIRQLRLFPKGKQPPFLYLTGERHIQGFAPNDHTTLKNYLLEGGMLFADAGSATFDRDFRTLIGQVLPGMRLIDIPDDDPLYQLPFEFPDGAPRLWHHGGDRALGIKHQGRWICFYHPGDMNDAWKTGTAKPEVTEASMNLGVNILYYSITKYLEMTAGAKK